MDRILSLPIIGRTNCKHLPAGLDSHTDGHTPLEKQKINIYSYLIIRQTNTIFYQKCNVVERGSSVGRMPDSQSREPGFECPLLPFRSLGILFHFTTPQSTQLYK